MLAERWNTVADHAFLALRKYARRHRLPLDQVARAVVERVEDDAALRREVERANGGRPQGLPFIFPKPTPPGHMTERNQLGLGVRRPLGPGRHPF
ncbi:ANTAR domain-containing protein [Streptomyces dysideae]|uniref:ANTAR domain-containing protein n=1 Tax=Streptomyces dysideae TaxID=909626 RepID=UPI00099F3DD6|nr:ANTAR domain-containing protein [Streptomyces dysideae]